MVSLKTLCLIGATLGTIVYLAIFFRHAIDLAHGSNFVHSVSNMVRQAWFGGDQKTIRLWPNLAPAENWSPLLDYSDMDRRLYSPGMLYQTP